MEARCHRSLRAVVRDTRGAVYVEFLIAFLPLLIFFECLVQLGGLYNAQLITLHSAATAARAATVVLHDDPARYDDAGLGQYAGKRKEDIEKAAALPLRANRSIVDFTVELDKAQYGRDDLIRVEVEAVYRCQVPFARRLVCNFFTSRRTLRGEAALPNNGADYVYQ